MAEERGLYRKFKDSFSIVFAFGLVGLGLYTYGLFIGDSFVPGIILFVSSSFSMFVIFAAWRRFTEKYAANIIYWSTQQKWLRKLVAGGSFSYYEYKDNIYKIGLFEPVSRFMSMMIAFIGLASSLAKAAGITELNPAKDPSSTIIWAVLIFLVPIILTPIVPIIWAMEDLQLKSWNEKHKTNLKVSIKYKARFNSFIAIGSLGVAFGLSREAGASLEENLVIFLNLIFAALRVLIYPVSILTLLYYLYFRGTVIDKIRDKMTIPIAETRLIYRNIQGQILNKEGEILSEKPKDEIDLIKVIAAGGASPSQEDLENDERQPRFWNKFGKKREKPEIVEISTLVDRQETQQITDKEPGEGSDEKEEKNLPQKIGSGAKNAVVKTSDSIVGAGKSVVGGVKNVGKSISDNTIGRVFGGKKKDNDNPELPKPKRKGGTATEGLWDKEEKEIEPKFSGGSATAGLWEKDDKKKKKKEK